MTMPQHGVPYRSGSGLAHLLSPAAASLLGRRERRFAEHSRKRASASTLIQYTVEESDSLWPLAPILFALQQPRLLSWQARSETCCHERNP